MVAVFYKSVSLCEKHTMSYRGWLIVDAVSTLIGIAGVIGLATSLIWPFWAPPPPEISYLGIGSVVALIAFFAADHFITGKVDPP